MTLMMFGFYAIFITMQHKYILVCLVSLITALVLFLAIMPVFEFLIEMYALTYVGY